MTLVLALLLFGDLHVAVRSGEFDRVKALLQQGVNVNERDSLGGTALHDAAWAGDLKMAELLLDSKADPNLAHLEGGSTPLHYAVITNHPELVELLLARGAKLKTMSASGATALHLAANRGFVNIVVLLLAKGFEVDTPDAKGSTALDEAAWKGEAEVVKLLLARGGKPQNALYAAATRGHAAVIPLLLDAGADPLKPDPSGATALEIALALRQPRTVGALLDRGVKLKSVAPLQTAVLRGDYEMVELLLNHKFDPNTPNLLHDAALKGHLRIVELLVAKGADPRRKNAQGATPLHDAALAGHLPVAEYLLEKGAPPDEPDAESAATPLHNAASFGRLSVVQLLLDRGADPNKPNKAGQTPLAAARANGHNLVADLLSSRSAR